MSVLLRKGELVFTLVLFSLPPTVSLCGRGLFFMLNEVYDFSWRRLCTVHLAVRW